jgi:serine/threonine protein kinase
MEYVSNEFLDRRTMEIVRCLIQNLLKNKKDKSIKQFAYVSRQALTGRLNPNRNILTDIKTYERYGIDAVISDAKVMGSVATILRCNITDFNMDVIRKFLNETTWRLASQFNQAQQIEMDSLLSIFHNYIVGIVCGNPTRTWSPNVAYTYGMYASQCPKTFRRNFCTMVEKVNTLPQQDSVQLLLKNGRMTPDLFLSVFYQLALTLEIMQSQHGYCHFDLNAENILMRPVYKQSGNGVQWSYMIYGTQYTLKNIQFFATMSDYQYSCFDKTLTDTGTIAMDNQFIGMGKFKKYGIMDFMVPGFDLFVFLNSVRNLTSNSLDPNNTKNFLVDPYAQENNLMILNFIDYVLKNIYQLPDIYANLDIKSKMNYRYYNVLLCKGAGLSPLALLEKVVKSGIVKSVLEIQKDPLDTAPRNSYVPTICKKKIPLFLTDLLPNWRNVVEETFVEPPLILEIDEIPTNVDTLLNMIKNKQFLFEFDYRPLMTNGGAIATETIDYYNNLVFNKNGYYNGYYDNTLMFYNYLMTFLNTYYYKYYIQDKEYIETFAENNDKLSILFKYIQQPQFVSKVASIIRFCQTIKNLNSANERNFCCIKKKDTLGNMGQSKKQQQSLDYLYQSNKLQSTTQCGQLKTKTKQQKQQKQQNQQKQQQVVQQKKQQVVQQTTKTLQQQNQRALKKAQADVRVVQSQQQPVAPVAQAGAPQMVQSQQQRLLRQSQQQRLRRQAQAAAGAAVAPAPVAQAGAPQVVQSQQQRLRRQAQAAAGAAVAPTY